MTDKAPINVIRVICSGGAVPHVVRELAVLHRRQGRPDLALAALRTGMTDLANQYMQFEPGGQQKAEPRCSTRAKLA